MERMVDLSNGYGLWRRKEPHGGYSYWTDDVGGGRVIFDEGLDSWSVLLELLMTLYGKMSKEEYERATNIAINEPWTGSESADWNNQYRERLRYVGLKMIPWGKNAPVVPDWIIRGPWPALAPDPYPMYSIIVPLNYPGEEVGEADEETLKMLERTRNWVRG